MIELHTLKVTQVEPLSPVYRGECQTCGAPVEVVETWAANEAIYKSHKRGFWGGYFAGCLVALGGYFVSNLLFEKGRKSGKEEKETERK